MSVFSGLNADEEKYIEINDKAEYDLPIVHVKIGDRSLDMINEFKSMSISKKGGDAYQFNLELFDPTFEIDMALLNYSVPITVSYKNRNGSASYKGMIINNTNNPVLHSGVEITATGYLTSVPYTNNQGRSYPASQYGGSCFKILAAVAKDMGVALDIRDEVKDFIITYQGNPTSVTSDAEESDMNLIRRVVKYLGEFIDFTLIPADPNKKGSKDTLAVFSTNNAATKKSKSVHKYVLDLNHKNSMAVSYKFDITKLQFVQNGGMRKLVSVDASTNTFNEFNYDASKYTGKADDSITGINQITKTSVYGASKDNIDVMRAKSNVAKNLLAMYQMTLDLEEGLPHLVPFVTEIDVNAYISSPTSQLKTKKHHSSGSYVVKEVTDTITANKISTNIIAMKMPEGLSQIGNSSTTTTNSSGNASNGKITSKLNPTAYPCLPLSEAYKYLTFSHPTDKDNLDPVFLGRLAALAKDQGWKKLNLSSGYRPTSSQEVLFKKDGGYFKNGSWQGGTGYVAKPGNSWHEYGVAIDTDNGNLKAMEKYEPTAKQLTLKKYGLFKPMTVGNGTGPKEDWHIQPIETNGQNNNKNAWKPAGLV